MTSFSDNFFQEYSSKLERSEVSFSESISEKSLWSLSSQNKVIITNSSSYVLSVIKRN